MSNMKRAVDIRCVIFAQTALLKFDPVKTLERVAEDRNAVLNGIEDRFTQSQEGEQSALRKVCPRWTLYVG